MPKGNTGFGFPPRNVELRILCQVTHLDNQQYKRQIAHSELARAILLNEANRRGHIGLQIVS